MEENVRLLITIKHNIMKLSLLHSGTNILHSQGRRAFFAFLLCLSALGMWAQPTGKYNLVVELTDGNKQAFLLSTRPTITFESDKFVIAQAEANVEFEISKVASFSFAEVADNIQALMNEGYTISYTDGKYLTIYGSKITNDVSIVSIDGIAQQVQLTRHGDDALVVSLEGLRQGVYIVAINGKQNFKIVKR